MLNVIRIGKMENKMPSRLKNISGLSSLHRKSYYLTHFYGGWGAGNENEKKYIDTGNKEHVEANLSDRING